MQEKTIKKLIVIIEIALLVEMIALLLVGNKFMTSEMVRYGVFACVVFGSGGIIFYQTEIYKGQTVGIAIMIVALIVIGKSFF